MFNIQVKKADSSTKLSSPDQGKRHLCMTAAAVAASLVLSACGGGGSDGRPSRSSSIGVTIGGQPGSYIPISPGGALALTLRAGQSVSLDAGEPVVWNMYIGSTQVTYGAQVVYGGVTFDVANLNAYVVAVQTYAPFLLREAVNVTMVATSTYDSVQIATVYLSVVN